MNVAIITPDRDFEKSVAKSIISGIREWHGSVHHIKLSDDYVIDNDLIKNISNYDIFVVGTDVVLGNLNPVLLSFFSELQKHSSEGRLKGKLGLAFSSSMKLGSLDALQAIHRIFLNLCMTIPVVYPDLHKRQKTLYPLFTSYGLLLNKAGAQDLTEDMKEASEIFGQSLKELHPLVKQSLKGRKASTGLKKKRRGDSKKHRKESEEEKNISEQGPGQQLKGKLKSVMRYHKHKKEKPSKSRSESSHSEKKKSYHKRRKRSKSERKKSLSSSQEDVKSESSEKKKSKRVKKKIVEIEEVVKSLSSSSSSSSEESERMKSSRSEEIYKEIILQRDIHQEIIETPTDIPHSE